MSILETNKIQAFDGDNVTLSATKNIQVQADLYVTGAAQLTGNLTGTNAIFSGTVTAEEFITNTVSSSVMYRSGSTRLGDSSDDVHTITGGIYHTGNLIHTGNSSVTGSGAFTSTLEIGGVINVSSSLSTLNTKVTVATGSITVNEHNIIHILEKIGVATGSINVNETNIATNLQKIGVATGSINVNETGIATNLQKIGVATGSIWVNETGIATNLLKIGVATGSINVNETNIGAANAVINTLTAATSSYALGANLTIATASISANEASIVAINAATSSFAFTTGSIFTGKQELTGSIDVSGSISIKPTGDGGANRLSFDTGEFHVKSPGFYWMTDSVTIGSQDESTLFAQLDANRLQVRTLLTLKPVTTKPTDLTAGTLAVSGSTPIYCDGANWYPINLGTALP